MKKIRRRARALIKGYAEAEKLYGTVLFTDRPAGVRVETTIKGLPENKTGFYGFHLHEGQSCKPPDFQSAQGHYDPKGVPHPMHSGDFPSLIATDSGEAWLAFFTTRFTVSEIIGKTVVVHMERDDFSSQPAGDAGKRIGCGVLEPF